MRSRTLAKRYARALLALATEEGNQVAVAEALGQVATVLVAPSVAMVVRNPAVGVDGRRTVVRSICSSLGIPRVLANCLFLLAERHRLDMVDDLARAYLDLLDEALGRTRVIIRSAVPLPEGHVQEILGVLQRRVPRRELIPVLEVDPDLLGGVVCEAEGIVYDGSVKAQVSRLARRMVAEGRPPA
jgi:F-type H+-transporting ATPase subunit delta